MGWGSANLNKGIPRQAVLMGVKKDISQSSKLLNDSIKFWLHLSKIIWFTDLAEVQSVGLASPIQMHGSKRIDEKAFFDVSWLDTPSQVILF